MKRLFDISISLFGLLAFGPMLIIISILIKLEDGQSVFFVQERIGLHKKPFFVFKFRTMSNGQVTRVGKWLRNTGLDELPQIISIIKGDMTIVGPRPLTQFDIDRLRWNTVQATSRWYVKPGLTGLAQITGGVSASASLEADMRYIKTQSLTLDLKIIFYSFCINMIGKKIVRNHLIKTHAL